MSSKSLSKNDSGKVSKEAKGKSSALMSLASLAIMSSNSPSKNDSENVPKETKGKRAVLMKELIALRDAGIKLDVEFDKDGEAIGKIGDKYKSYIGVLARTKVPIDIPTWKHVGADIKEEIWDDVLSIFNIPLSKKKEVITIASNRWANFKSVLTSSYVYKKPLKKRKLPKDDDPLLKYPYIKPEVWKRFKATRMTDEFQATSNMATEKQKRNIYPHRMSRGGYRKARINLEKKMLAENLTDESNENATVTIERDDLWIEARVDKAGECLNPETKQAIERIHSLKEQALKGEFVPTGKDDILTKALGTDEHYGRVRGVGGTVGHKQYFGKCKRRRDEGISKEYLDTLTQMITEKVRGDVLREIDTIIERRTMGGLTTKYGNTSYSIQRDPALEISCKSGNASCYEDDEFDPFGEIPEKGLECELAVDDIELRKVALGRVFQAPTRASKSHGRAFGENEFRVSIDAVLDGEEDAHLPLLTEEFSTVGEAVGSFVRWPKNLITIGRSKINQVTRPQISVKGKNGKSRKANSEKLKKVQSAKSKTKKSFAKSNDVVKTTLDPKYESRKLLSKVVSMMDDGRKSELTLSEDIMGYEQTILLAKDDIDPLLSMKKLNLSCIKTFVRYLHSICDTGRYGFLCPEMTSLIGHDADALTTYISDWMNKGKKLIYLAPYYKEERWTLALIDIVEHNQVYWFDPLGQSEPMEFKTLLNTSIRLYDYKGGARKSTKIPQWVKVNCARQASETESGYYVMRYMFGIIASSNLTRSVDEHFKKIGSFSQEEIDEVRDLWADYFLNN